MSSQTHISREEWIRFFAAGMNDETGVQQRAHVLGHIAVCPECRAFYEQAADFRAAARACAGAAVCGNARENGAYRAVASAGAGSADGKRKGMLCVDIDLQEDDAFFMEETLDMTGCAEKYALNPENGGRSLADDLGALTLSLDQGQLKIFFRDGTVRAEAQLKTEMEDIPVIFEGSRAETLLPKEPFCMLEILFCD